MKVKIVHEGGPAFHFSTKSGVLHLERGRNTVADLSKQELNLLETLAKLNAVRLQIVPLEERAAQTTATSKLAAMAKKEEASSAREDKKQKKTQNKKSK
jgi:Ser/Thr protein kinase RdoA (MazF antagonist)